MSPRSRRHLPSLGALATFEVAAKHLSFTLAAKELNVTQGAISQQIRVLERALAMPLFLRKHNALALTPQGVSLFASVANGLDIISAGVAELTGVAEPQTITISATDAMASYWLTRQIDSFRALYPDVSFTILASDEDDALRNYSEVDIAILCGNERCEFGDQLHYMFPEVAQPVCTPGFCDAFGPFDAASRLLDVPLLHLHERHWVAEAIGWQPLGWFEWFRAQGCAAGPLNSVLSSNKVSLLMEATLAGRGVMLGWHHMVQPYIDDGRLVFAHPAPITAGRGNFMSLRKKQPRAPCIDAFLAHALGQDNGLAAGQP